jgi:SAM-dependent methyltransferase
MSERIRQELGIDELRDRFAEYTRAAYAALPSTRSQRILELGCGRGAVTLRLARLSESEIVGIDIDEAALADLALRIEAKGLSRRVRILRRSLLETGLADEHFGLIWAEGVVHIPGMEASLAECNRVLEPGGAFVLAEALAWMEPRLRNLPRFGFELVEKIPWEPGCWWRLYGEPLEARIRKARERDWGAEELAELSLHAGDVDQIRKDVADSDCAHYILRKVPAHPA